MVDIIRVLMQIEELDFWSKCPIDDATDEELAYPPKVIWRFKYPSPALAEFFRETVAGFPGTIRWEFKATERNWGLMPAHVGEYSRAHNLGGERPAAAELKIKDPDFGKRANAELRLLAEHIAKAAATAVISR
jgi:hypothetical protein